MHVDYVAPNDGKRIESESALNEVKFLVFGDNLRSDVDEEMWALVFTVNTVNCKVNSVNFTICCPGTIFSFPIRALHIS